MMWQLFLIRKVDSAKVHKDQQELRLACCDKLHVLEVTLC